MLALKSFIALPNHIRIMRKDVSPIINPKKPIQADILCIAGLSNAAVILAPNLCRNEMNVNVNRNIVEDASAMAINAAAAVGADKRRPGAFFGSTERSYSGDTVAGVQLRPAELLEREQEPKTPMNTLGPSTDEEDPD